MSIRLRAQPRRQWLSRYVYHLSQLRVVHFLCEYNAKRANSGKIATCFKMGVFLFDAHLRKPL